MPGRGLEIGTGPSEDRHDWLRLLNRLETRGLRPETGLQLFVHDGGAALIAALRKLFPDVAHQRCVFHKLRNMLRAIVPAPGLPKEDRRTYVHDVIQHAARIWNNSTYEEALRRYQRFRRRWELEQPAMAPPWTEISPTPGVLQRLEPQPVVANVVFAHH